MKIFQQKQQERLNMVEFFSKKQQNSSQTTNLSQKSPFINESLTNTSNNQTTQQNSSIQLQQTQDNSKTNKHKTIQIEVNNKETLQINTNKDNLLNNKDNISNNIPKTPNNMIYVPCMNCKELISMEQIDKHSNICKIQKEDQYTPIEEVNIRFEKLMELFLKLIDDLASSANNNISSAFEMIVNLLTRMYEIAHEMKEFNIEKNNSSQMFKELMNEIVLINKAQPGSLGIKLHLERLFCLANVKLKLMKVIQQEKVKKPKEKKIQQDKYKRFTIEEESPRLNEHQKSKSNFKDLIEVKKQEMLTLKRESNIFQQKVDQNLKEINKLMKIPSTETDNISQKSLGSSKQKSFRQSQQSISDFQDSQFDGIDDINFNIDYNSNEDDKQRLFYSKCLSILMKIESNSLAQKIPISILYKEVVNLGLQIDEWDYFINNAYNHCEEYLDVNRFRKGLKNNLKGVAKRLELQNKIQQ